eukprot:TRINITY_DN95979_c0_g1_i1.p1 TRINITY_DN95979_c0_g1~~TRINITY_DN95979_c0_g1_i1.p1  ORF type:complete len:363 (+),score=46.77 TRINITY_DN95979_c0_g1_i1:95-1183(+)
MASEEDLADIGYVGSSEVPTNGSFEQVLMIITPTVAILDLLDKSKTWPKIVMVIIGCFTFTEDGSRLGIVLFEHLISGSPEVRRALLAVAWVAIIRWWSQGRSSHPCPLWSGFLILLAYVCLCASLQGNRVASVVELTGALPAQTCEEIVRAANEHGRTVGWSTTRHGTGGLSTEDIPLKAIKGLEHIPQLLATTLAPLTTKFFGGELVPRDTFVVRYVAGRGNATGGYLRSHTDAGTHTYSIVLSDLTDYEGGGVRFPLLPLLNETDGIKKAPRITTDIANGNRALPGFGQVLRISRGNVLLQPAKLFHEGMPLETGTRYLLISFNNIRYSNWQSWLQGLLDFRGRLAQRAHLQRVQTTDL